MKTIKHFNARQTAKMTTAQLKKVLEHGPETCKKVGEFKYTKKLTKDMVDIMGKKAIKNGAMAVAFGAFAVGLATVFNSFRAKDKMKTEYIEYQRNFINDLEEKLDDKQEIIETQQDIIDTINVKN